MAAVLHGGQLRQMICTGLGKGVEAVTAARLARLIEMECKAPTQGWLRPSSATPHLHSRFPGRLPRLPQASFVDIASKDANNADSEWACLFVVAMCSSLSAS
jgi:hypothetical protein